MNWKAACKHWYEQFKVWVKAYNEVADIYMVSNTGRTANNDVTAWFVWTPFGGLEPKDGEK